MNTHEAAIRLWPRLIDFAHAVGAPYESVKQWNRAGRIPAPYWLSVVEAARLIGKTITVEELAEAIDKRKAA
ncbi:hypothetical protein [Azospirillum canadense]|uniref:hypothetical protein n=1 Tax=Azospirillum canadense TaxID=403962 RepID=UPI002227BC30|nr:hypothetical protein [Azospirillum canadense]MCW2242321.1 hypothetical protein [Azospirillum canadense]